jgi:hypothetical protein
MYYLNISLKETEKWEANMKFWDKMQTGDENIT